MRLSILRFLDTFFPPDSSALMNEEQQSLHEIGKAQGSMGDYLGQLKNRDVDCLDFGCGWGGETIWLADRVRSVVGIDVEEKSIDEARRRLAAQPQTLNCRFVHYDGVVLPFEDNSFDAVFSTDVFEHVPDVRNSLREINRVLRPEGVLVSHFGPLFYSPQGYHLYWACQVPYAHLVFGLDAILKLRNERAPESIHAGNWLDMGLNKITARMFKESALEAGFSIEKFDLVPVRGLKNLSRIPVIGNLFIFGLQIRLKKEL